MPKSGLALAAVSLILAVAILLGVFVFRWQSDGRSPAEPTAEATAVNLGITYLTLTPALAAYYSLGAYSGALVTSVASNSLADRAGVKVGDVILSFNGARLEEGASLFGMMRACPAGNRIVLEVWGGKGIQTVELVHTER